MKEAFSIHETERFRRQELPGNDGASVLNGMGHHEKDASQRYIRDAIRDQCRQQLEACARNESSAMTQDDVEEYMQALSEGNLEQVADKEKVLKDHRDHWITNFIQQANTSGQKAMYLIEDAASKHWITPEKARWWKQKLKEGRWTEKREFIDSELPQWKERWGKLHIKLEELKNLKKELGITEEQEKSISELAKLTTNDFAKAKCPYKINMVELALGKLAALKKDKGTAKGNLEMYDLFNEARDILTEAAEQGIISKSNIGVLLRRMTKDENDPKKFAAFVRGKAPFNLRMYLDKCSGLRERFDGLHDLKEKEGPPPSFRFVHLNVFLNWPYKKQKAYVTEGEKRFEDIDKERPDFRIIRHELDAKNWEEAEELINEAKTKSLSEADRKKLVSMEKYLTEHRSPTSLDEKEENPTNDQLVDQLNSLVAQLPFSMQKLYVAALQRGYKPFWVLCTLMYNRVWCHTHHYLDENREIDLEQQAKHQTPMRIRDGHQMTGLEVNDVTAGNSRRPAIRDQEHVKAPQILFSNETTDADMMAKNLQDNEDCYNFWYWTSLIDKNVEFKHHQQIVQEINPQMKSIMRQLDNRGVKLTSEYGKLTSVKNTPSQQELAIAA